MFAIQWWKSVSDQKAQIEVILRRQFGGYDYVEIGAIRVPMLGQNVKQPDSVAWVRLDHNYKQQ